MGRFRLVISKDALIKSEVKANRRATVIFGMMFILGLTVLAIVAILTH